MLHTPTMTQKWITLLAVAALLAGAFAALRPAPAQAALCAAYHVVTKNETLKSIAKFYKVNYKVLAKANDINVNEPLVKGDKLCIPKVGPGEPNMTLTVTAKGGKVFINVGSATREDRYLVKVREGDSGPWTNLGRFSSGVKGTIKQFTFLLPDKLKSKLYLTVCLKNQSTNALTCRPVVNVP
jgi:LysM repeat protein